MIKLNIQEWEVERVQPYELNAKIHDKDQVERIAKSIKDFGWDQPIVVDKDGVIIKGHGRRLAAISLGITKVPVWVRDDLTAEQARAARLADNRVAVGDIDADILKQELADFNLDFLDGIFDQKELDFMFADMAEINFDAVVTDLDTAVSEQDEQTLQKLLDADARPVPIQKALGFKEVFGKDERVIVRFMAVAEGETGLEGASAFVSYLNQLMGASAS